MVYMSRRRSSSLWGLHNPPDGLMQQFMDAAKAAGWSPTQLMFQLARDYLAGRITPSVPPPPRVNPGAARDEP